MRDPYFEQCVVLLCQHDASGALGLVINRDSAVPLQAVLDQLDLDDSPHEDRPTWWGGPVDPGTGFVIWQGKTEPNEGWNPITGLAVSPSVECLSRLLARGTRFNLCLGYAGWGPGQLDGEIETGSWLYADIDPNLVFETPMSERYDRALSLLGLTRAMVWMAAVDE